MYVIKDKDKFWTENDSWIKNIKDADHFDLPENHVKLIARRLSKTAIVVEVEDNGG